MSSPAITPPAWRRSTFAIALIGSVLMWAAMPPWPLALLGWIAPVPWLLLVCADELPGRRPYRALYLAGLVYWLLAISWLILPYPMLTWIGWLALSAYLAIYLPLFVGLSRIAVHRFALPLWLAAPIVWTGLELARAHVMTGFLMASLAHTQMNWTTLIQVSDLVGEYGVDFVMLLVAACLAEVLRISGWGLRTHRITPKSKLPRILIALAPAALALAAVLGYGDWRIGEADRLAASAKEPGPRVALIQGNSLAEWKLDPTREQQIMRQYVALSEEAVASAQVTGDGRPLDLIIWPETMYRNPLRDFDAGFKLPSDVKLTTEDILTGDRRQLANLAARLGTPLLVGVDRFHFVNDDRSASTMPTIQSYNAAALVDRDGTLIGTYDKMHRVMFGEYIPFADWIPYLYKITPLTGGIIAGREPAALRLGAKYCFAPNICYETAIPHVIRRQVAMLQNRGDNPDALVNLTNDAWYSASSELDMHLACDVFRAVETRTPLVIAANGGISASIDRAGRIKSRLGKQQAGFLLADITPGHMPSWYVRFGDWFAALCLAGCLFFVIVE
jgi:apolipoprotein N-acyltransferase